MAPIPLPMASRQPGWLLLFVLLAGCGSERAPDVLLFVTDTVRADRTSAYGYERPTTPQLDALATLGALFEDVTAPSCWTLPSHASMFTGEPPWVHGAHRLPADGVDENAVAINGWRVSKLRPDRATLAERLAKAGYRTVALSANPWFNYDVGLSRGFDHAEILPDPRSLVRAVQDEIARPHLEPLFLFVNVMEAHAPYADGPPPWSLPNPEWLDEQTAPDWVRPYLMMRRPGVDLTGADRKLPAAALQLAKGRLEIPVEGFDMLGTLYDAGVVGADFVLHQVVPAWAERFPTSALVVTSDHGEALGEHRALSHEFSVYPETLRVPLVLVAPGRVPAGARVETPVRLQDVHDTILELARVEDAPPHSLIRVAAGEPAEGPIAAEVWPDRGLARHVGGRYAHSLRLYREGDEALVLAADRAELYDLARDPRMDHDTAASRPERVRELRARAVAHFASGEGPAVPASISPELSEQLESLGYVDR